MISNQKKVIIKTNSYENNLVLLLCRLDQNWLIKFSKCHLYHYTAGKKCDARLTYRKAWRSGCGQMWWHTSTNVGGVLWAQWPLWLKMFSFRSPLTRSAALGNNWAFTKTGNVFSRVSYIQIRITLQNIACLISWKHTKNSYNQLIQPNATCAVLRTFLGLYGEKFVRHTGSDTFYVSGSSNSTCANK